MENRLGHSPPPNSQSPRPVLSPSNLNNYGDNAMVGTDARPESPRAVASPAARPGSALVGRSPRDRMKIDTLLASPRSPWSPRSLMGRAGIGPQRFTNRIDGRKPRKTNLTNSVHHTSPSPGPGDGSPGSKRTTHTSARAGGASSSVATGESNDTGTSFGSLRHAVASSSSLTSPRTKRGNNATTGGGAPGAPERPAMSEEERREALLLLNCGVPSISADIKEEAAGEAEVGPHKAPGSDLSYMAVNLFVAAVGDGKVAEGTPAKMREVLDQVVTKVSKEQNTVVSLQHEGPIHIQLRVFAENSGEAKTLREYVTSNLEQSPAPFVVLARQLPMGVTYDPGSLDPSNASVADRLRKQAKTRAIKLLREVIFDASSGITSAILRGYSGPMDPAQRLDTLINERVTTIDSSESGPRFILFPAIVRRAADLATPSTSHTPASSAHAAAASGEDAAIQTAAPPLSTHPAVGSASWQVPNGGGSPRHFPVSLTVIAIGDGHLSPDTQPKLLHRLQQISTKVPKEHNLSVDLPQEGSLTLKLRLFVVNSEDAKATREYVKANINQRPAPIVVLSHSLPIAVSYDARALDVSGANAVDCLRKQAKSRAVKLIKELLSSPSIGMKMRHLRGHEGATRPAEMLETPLMSHAIEFEEGKRFITFAVRNRNEAGGSGAAGGAGAGGSFPGLDSLADAAAMNLDVDDGGKKRVKGEGGGGEGRGPMLSQQRICELCASGNDGSYGTGRFCSKSCRYEAHALQVAQRRRGPATIKGDSKAKQQELKDSEEDV